MPAPAIRRRSLILAAPLLPAVVRAGHAQPVAELPRQGTRLVVPFAPGGSTDVIARILAPGMGAALGGHSVVVENRGGAAGMLGAEAVANAAPDGGALAFFTITNAVLNIGLHRNARIDVRRAFAPVSLAITMPMVLTVGNHVPARSLPELVALMKSRPRPMTYGSAGPGSINHLGAHLFTQRSGTQATHIPYRGAGLVFADMIAGHVDMLVEGIASQAPQVRAGQVRAMAVLASRRSPLLPEVPTAIEQGVPDFEILNWMGVFAPAATPRPVLQRLESAVRGAVHDEVIAQRLREAGVEPVGSTAAELEAFWDAQIRLWLPVVQASGVTID
jgi:tripartite-type tricarboxylate transporter receptor subunit TctC